MELTRSWQAFLRVIFPFHGHSLQLDYFIFHLPLVAQKIWRNLVKNAQTADIIRLIIKYIRVQVPKKLGILAFGLDSWYAQMLLRNNVFDTSNNNDADFWYLQSAMLNDRERGSVVPASMPFWEIDGRFTKADFMVVGVNSKQHSNSTEQLLNSAKWMPSNAKWMPDSMQWVSGACHCLLWEISKYKTTDDIGNI